MCADGRGLLRSHGAIAEQRDGVACERCMMDQPGGEAFVVVACNERGNALGVEHAAALPGQRILDGAPGELVSEGQCVAVTVENPPCSTLIDCRRRW